MTQRFSSTCKQFAPLGDRGLACPWTADSATDTAQQPDYANSCVEDSERASDFCRVDNPTAYGRGTKRFTGCKRPVDNEGMLRS